MKHPTQVIKDTEPWGPTRHLLHKATLPRLRIIADKLIEKNSEAAKMVRQRTMHQRKKTGEITRKRAK